MNKNIYFSFVLLLLSSLITIFFVPQFELPDGTHHLVKVILVENGKLELNSIFDYINEIYFILYQPFHHLSLILPLNDICDYMRSAYKTNCNFQTSFNNEFRFNNNSFSKFGLDLLIYDYFVYGIFKHKISLFIFNSFIYTLLFIVFKNRLVEKKFIEVLILFLIFPSVISISSYVSPNFLSVIFNIFIFYLFLSKKYYVAFFLSLLFTIIDNQNIVHLCSLGFFLFFFNLNKFSKINFFSFLLLLTFFYTLLIFLKPYIYYFITITSSYSMSDLNYLSEEINLINIFKIITSFYLSLYYIGGSMQFLASLIEYYLFFLFFAYYLFKNLIKVKLSNFDFESENYSIFIYFILINLSVLFVVTMFPTISQGRYYFILLLPIFYYFIKKINLNRYYLYEIIIFFIFVINFFHSYKIFLKV